MDVIISNPVMFLPIFNFILITDLKTMVCNSESPAIAIKFFNVRSVASNLYYTVTTEGSQIISPSCCMHRVYHKTFKVTTRPAYRKPSLAGLRQLVV